MYKLPLQPEFLSDRNNTIIRSPDLKMLHVYVKYEKNLLLGFRRERCLKMLTDDGRTDGRMTDGQRTHKDIYIYYKLTYEPLAQVS